jgi:hypothetical protein
MFDFEVKKTSKKCRGLIFKGYRSFFLSNTESIEERRGLRLLKRESCKCLSSETQETECDYWIMESLNDGDLDGYVILPKEIKDNVLYKAIVTNISKDFETGVADSWNIEFQEIRSPYLTLDDINLKRYKQKYGNDIYIINHSIRLVYNFNLFIKQIMNSVNEKTLKNNYFKISSSVYRFIREHAYMYGDDIKIDKDFSIYYYQCPLYICGQRLYPSLTDGGLKFGKKEEQIIEKIEYA